MLSVQSVLATCDRNCTCTDFGSQYPGSECEHSGAQLWYPAPEFSKGTQFQFFADTGFAESDNITLAHADADKISQTVSMTDVDLAFQENTRSLVAALKGEFSYLDFLEHAFGSELVGRFDGFAAYTFVPEKLWWVLEDNFGQAQLDPFAPSTPLNRQNVNYATTGPRWVSYFTPANFLQLDLTASRTQYSVSPFDSNDFFGSLTLGHRRTADSTLALVLDADYARFDNTEVNTNFDRENLYARYELARGSRSDLSADLGATAIHAGGVTRSDPLVRLSLAHQLSVHTDAIAENGTGAHRRQCRLPRAAGWSSGWNRHSSGRIYDGELSESLCNDGFAV